MESIKAWWFEPANGLLGYGDGRKPEVGVTHEVDGAPILCERGVHASVRALDALGYAQSTIVYRVEISGDVVHRDDKIAGTRRTYLARVDATEILGEFARQCALDVAHLWDMPDCVRAYLETGRNELRAEAYDTARAAALDATLYAARAAAWAAARAAARDAAPGAALLAALLAAEDAAWAAARAAARDAAQASADATRDAARGAAWAAAWAAAQDRKAARLEAALLAQIAES